MTQIDRPRLRRALCFVLALSVAATPIAAAERAFYYVRVLEDPTCRWSQVLCNEAGVVCGEPDTVTRGFESCCTEDHRPTLQERAWTSPIWYTP